MVPWPELGTDQIGDVMSENNEYTNWQDVPLLLNAEEASRLLRVHLNTVRTMIKDGRLPATKVGREWRISREAIRALVERE